MHFFLIPLLTLFISYLSAGSDTAKQHVIRESHQKGSKIVLGVDRLFGKEYEALLRGKRIGLVTNHTAVNGDLASTISLFKGHAQSGGYTLKALFAPEHGLSGNQYASEHVLNSKDPDGIPIHSLHGDTRRPTADMLKNIDLIVYDIQDIGSRSYTYISTLFYVMEEASKTGISVIVLDRPNPINGIVVDGTLLEEKWRSMVGYINVPYCHGMTVGELALYFKGENKIKCPLIVIPMKGWKRGMSFQDTGLTWIPTSPHIPEASTAFYYPITGLLGELLPVNIGIGYTLPFKVVGAPFIDGPLLAKTLNLQKFPGVSFYPFFYRPFFGRYAEEDCQGVLILVTNPKIYQPVAIQYLLMGTLKNLYPECLKHALGLNKEKLTMFHKLNGTAEVYRLFKEYKFVIWKLRGLHSKERSKFLEKRKLYLLPDYK
jgi:uncharacterized protein YbbC (DUF1343 family)